MRLARRLALFIAGLESLLLAQPPISCTASPSGVIGTFQLGGGPFSLDFWVSIPPESPQRTLPQDFETVLRLTNSCTDINTFELDYIGHFNPEVFQYGVPRGGQATGTGLPASVIDGLLHHVIIIRDAPNVAIYVDGPQNSAIAPNWYYTATFVTGELSVGIPSCVLDRGSPGYRFSSFTGQVRDLALYNRALTAQEIQTSLTVKNPGSKCGCQGTSQWSFPALFCGTSNSNCISSNAPPNTNGACLLYKTPEDSNGVSFEAWCGNFVTPVCSHCFAFYRHDRDGSREIAGKCWFGGGVNSIHLYYDDDDAGGAACFQSSVWLNEQQDRNEEDPPLPPSTQWTPGDSKIDRWIYKHHVDADKTDIFVTKDMSPVFRVDPRIGANFNDLWPAVPDVPYTPVSSNLRASRAACDLNGDGKCDAQDQAVYAAALGSCMGAPAYNALADADGDGCVTANDFRTLFPATGDVNFDGSVNCTDVKIVSRALGKRVGQSGFDPRADVNLDGVVDIRDLAIVSQKLPTGTRCQ